jgi:predicted phage-related endonuclease
MIANPDRLLFPTESEWSDPPAALLEVKTARSSQEWGDPGTDDIPPYYQAQCLWQMDVLGADVVHLAVLIGGSDYREYRVVWDAEEAEAIRLRAAAFWQRLLDRIPPPVDDMESTGRTLRHLHGDVEDRAEPVAADVAAEYRAAQAASKQAKRDVQLATNRLLDVMGNARVAVDPDGSKVATRSVSTPKRFDKDRFAVDHPDLLQQYTVPGNPVVRLTPTTTGK